MHICDLHTHSTASDGQYTPTQLVQMAAAQNLDALAITDRDTIDGLSEAICLQRQALTSTILI